MALDKVTTGVITDDAVTGAKIENNPTVAGNLTVAGTSTLTGNATASGNVTVTGDIVPSTPFSHRNLIINGAFQVWQRSNSTSLETVANNNLKADRFKLNSDIQASDLTCARSTDVPAGQGFTNSMNVVPGGADTSIAAGHIATIVQFIEAQDLQHLCYGTSNAKSLTLSFWVKTNLTGSHSVSFVKDDSTAYACPIEYTVSAANTWEKKEITLSPTAGSTSLITSAAGAIANDNGRGLAVCWNLAAGSTYQGTNNTWQAGPASGYGLATSNVQNFVGSTSNNIYLTGVQLEVGSSTTPFEHRTYADEIQRCYRYFQNIQYVGSWGNGTGKCRTTTSAYTSCDLLAPMRVAPTTITLPTIGQAEFNITYLNGEAYPGTHGSMQSTQASPYSVWIHLHNFSTIGAGTTSVTWAYIHSSCNFKFDAEL